MADTYDRSSKIAIDGQTLDYAKYMKDELDRIAVRVGAEATAPLNTSNASARANRQLENHNYAGRSYADLNLIVNHRDIALTLNDGTLIYNS